MTIIVGIGFITFIDSYYEQVVRLGYRFDQFVVRKTEGEEDTRPVIPVSCKVTEALKTEFSLDSLTLAIKNFNRPNTKGGIAFFERVFVETSVGTCLELPSDLSPSENFRKLHKYINPDSKLGLIVYNG
jgi:hypothetical protein